MLAKTQENIQSATKIQKEVKQHTLKKIEVKQSKLLTETETTSLINAETATLQDIMGASENFNSSMVALISELDGQVTNMGSGLSDLQKNTKLETVLSWFNKTKSLEMREKRIRDNDISDNLTDVLSTATHITSMLHEQEAVITEQLTIANTTLKEVMSERTKIKSELSTTDSKINDSASELKSLQVDIDMANDVATKAQLEELLSGKRDAHNVIVDEQKLLTTQDQNFDRLSVNYTTTVDSLSAQLSNQKIMIDKLKTDTHHRAMITEQYLASVKTNEQQAAAHSINRIGMHVDASMHEQMNAFKTVSENQFADMVEGHAEHMNRLNSSTEQGQRAAEQFEKRFNVILEAQKNTGK